MLECYLVSFVRKIAKPEVRSTRPRLKLNNSYFRNKLGSVSKFRNLFVPINNLKLQS